MARRVSIAALILIGVPAPAATQSRSGVALTPFVGLTLPRKDLLLRPGEMAGRDQEKQAWLAMVGGRITIGLAGRFELEGDVGYGSSSLKLSTLSTPSGTKASVLTMSSRVAFRFNEPIAPFWVTVHAGVAGVHRTFTEVGGQAASPIADKTNVGAILGATFGFPVNRRAAVTIGIDDFIYNASFAVAQRGPLPAGTTLSLTQNDLRLSIGVRLAVIGF